METDAQETAEVERDGADDRTSQLADAKALAEERYKELQYARAEIENCASAPNGLPATGSEPAAARCWASFCRYSTTSSAR